MSYIDVLNDAADRADAASKKTEEASQLLEDIVNGPEDTFVTTLNGDVPTAATAIEDLRSQITAGAVAPIQESVTLEEDNQTNITFENIETSGIAVYIDDDTAEGAYRYFNFTVDGTNSIILDDTFNEGTIVWGLSQEIGGSVETAVDQTQANAQLAEDWAIKTDETVDGEEYSSKYYAQESSDSADAASTSASDASNSADMAAISESNASTSEQNASDSADAAATSETNASDSASLSEDWATKTNDTVDGTEYSAKYYAQESSDSADAASTSASDASNSADAASTSASDASNSADAAESSSNDSEGFANDAATSETNASDSATLAEDWATKTNDTVDGTEYSSKYYAQESSDSADAAATSETNASDSADAAASSASNAATSEQNASDSADAAAISESNAATSEQNASNSADAAATSETNTENIYDQFDDRYLGSKASPPTEDNDGDSLQTGALYWSTDLNVMQVWDGDSWVNTTNEPAEDILDKILTVDGDGSDLDADTLDGKQLSAIESEYEAYVESYAYNKGQIDSWFSDIYAVTSKAFVKATSNRPAWDAPTSTTLEVYDDIALTVNSTIIEVSAGTPISLPSLSSGTDYTIYAAEDGSLEALDADDPAPSGKRKIGGFHASAENGEIVNTSMWDIKWRPDAFSPRAMVFDGKMRIWADIYLMDTHYGVNRYSRNGGTIANGADLPVTPLAFGGDGSSTYSKASWFTFVDLAAAAGKRLPNYHEFISCAYGVVEEENLDDDPVTTGHSADLRSDIGCEQITGCMFQWGNGAYGSVDTGTPAWEDWGDGRGEVYAASFVAPRLGGTYGGFGGLSGSRCSDWAGSPQNSAADTGARAVCGHVDY